MTVSSNSMDSFFTKACKVGVGTSWDWTTGLISSSFL
ncbi:hypothetical protein A2U01_0101781, partial [Trifolium medium]|nr:hypothetical protein [Trifolium medium]